MLLLRTVLRSNIFRKNFSLLASFILAVALLTTAACASSPSYSYYWTEFRDYAKQKNWKSMESLLKSKSNKFTANDKEMCPFVVILNLRGADVIRGWELLKKYNIYPDVAELNLAFGDSQPDNVVDYLLAGKIQSIHIGVLKNAISNKRFKYVPQLLAMVDTKNLDDRTTRANYKGEPENWKTEYSWTALIYAVQAESFETVKSLVELGADVNLRAEDGSTALSLAYDNGLVTIYDYLVAQGAREFTPRQVAQQPAALALTPSSSYSQPAAPAQSAQRPSAAQQLQEALRSPLQSGTYSLAGTQAKMSLTAIAKSGILTYTNQLGRSSMGQYQIDGNRMTVQAEGYTFIYTITSETSFSGNGQTWVRTGF